jgi:hypothetical protein
MTIPRTTTTPDAMPHSVLPTVFDHCTLAIQGKTTTSTIPCACTPPLLVTIKEGGGLPFKGDVRNHRRQHHATRRLDRTQYSARLSTQYWHSPQSTSPLAETWELPSLSRLACTPYYRHLRCKIIQCPRTPPCWTYYPAAGTRINLCVTVLPLASTSGTRKHAALLVGIRTARSGHRHKITTYFCSIGHHIIRCIAKYEGTIPIVSGQITKKNLSWGRLDRLK